MTPVIGSNNTNAASPACGRSSSRICSGPYAVDEIASGERAPSATGFDSFSDFSSSVIRGLPKNTRLAMSPTDAGMRGFSAELVTDAFCRPPGPRGRRPG